MEKAQRLFLVEDDVELASLIADYLRGYEFDVLVEHDGAMAVERILAESPDLVILDLMLPGEDGISICRRLRESYQQGILMLTASQESVDHVLALEIGADDFISKPVEPRILLAHVRSLLRRSEQSFDLPVRRVGRVEVSIKSRWVKVAGESVELTDKEFDLLVLLLNADATCSRDEISMALKGVPYDGESRYCDIMVSQLRNSLNVDGISGQHIKTVRNRGYMLVSEF